MTRLTDVNGSTCCSRSMSARASAGRPDKLESVIERLRADVPDLLPREEVVLVRPLIRDGTLRKPPILVGCEPEPQSVDDLTGETLLDLEDVLQRAVVLVGPDLRVDPG